MFFSPAKFYGDNPIFDSETIQIREKGLHIKGPDSQLHIPIECPKASPISLVLTSTFREPSR